MFLAVTIFLGSASTEPQADPFQLLHWQKRAEMRKALTWLLENPWGHDAKEEDKEKEQR